MSHSIRLDGKKIAVIVEHKFIPEEIEAYRNRFALLGAQVHFFSRIWYGAYKPGNEHWRPPRFYSDVDPGGKEWYDFPQELYVPEHHDVLELTLQDYAAVIMAANYTSVRLRWEEVPQNGDSVDPRAFVQSPPAVRLFADAMRDPRIVKGALCHGLWILTPHPELLRGRKVTCHTVVMADILNCGAEVQFDKDADGQARAVPVVTDEDLVTGYSKDQALPFIDAIAQAIHDRAGNPRSRITTSRLKRATFKRRAR